MSMQLYDALRDAGFSEEHALRVAKAVVGHIEELDRQNGERFVSSSAAALLPETRRQQAGLLAGTELTHHVASMKWHLVGWIVCCNVALALLVFSIARTAS